MGGKAQMYAKSSSAIQILSTHNIVTFQIHSTLSSPKGLEYPISRGCLDTDPIENSHSISIIKSSLSFRVVTKYK